MCIAHDTSKLEREKHCGWALRKSIICTIDFRKINSIDEVGTLFDFENSRSIGEFCVQDANDGFLHVFKDKEGERRPLLREPGGSDQKLLSFGSPGSLSGRRNASLMCSALCDGREHQKCENQGSAQLSSCSASGSCKSKVHEIESS